jgi:hypothetical protein
MDSQPNQTLNEFARLPLRISDFHSVGRLEAGTNGIVSDESMVYNSRRDSSVVVVRMLTANAALSRHQLIPPGQEPVRNDFHQVFNNMSDSHNQDE